MPAAPEIALTKFSSDVLPYVWRFSSWLHPDDDPELYDDIILTASVTCEPVSLTASPTVIEDDATAVRVFLSGGLPGLDYRVTVTVTTAAGLTGSSSRVLRITDDAR